MGGNATTATAARLCYSSIRDRRQVPPPQRKRIPEWDRVLIREVQEAKGEKVLNVPPTTDG
ncbi:hypothetical protein OUZ56_028872 [Daphnia magna]|uniref:Uncharacterized protein n=1 Tax=Daphnia magna TaxID=35525 RepID=A0ABR0B567_9CRUS|nr:hypothetical protein OUZ56_028872 [Daphnia magna]